MADKRDEKYNDDHSNAVMTHTSEAIPASDFIRSKNDLEKEPEMQRESKNFWQDAWAQLKRNKLAVVGMIGLIIIILLALIGPLLSSHDYAEQDVERRNLPAKIPVLDQIPFLPFDGEGAQGVDAYKEAGVKENFWFGTDQLGRDLWSRTWQGAQVSLFIGVVAALLDIFIGVVYGAISGFFGGRIDNVMQRIIEVVASIPTLIVVILFVLIFEPSIWTIILAMAITGWIGMSRVVRGEFLKLKNQEFVLASKTLGASKIKLIFKHILPNTLGVIVVTSMFTVPNAIFFEAFLSFIGIGVPAPRTSLGSLVNEGRAMLLIHPHELFIPALVLSLLILFFYLFSDGLRDAFDPKMRR
ncbi:peptide ABC transporter permease [Staphylococcus saprophyticus]|jgi:oligopeptide transport system permease protein|uniref:ABC-type dipeptide oligopeptide nickel transport system permease component n=1 Tax=Staphylococcus saprophyticus subsp. saprophyticus (strain ATCC 15305 / DSM 20229 / NCIMB 8711 / NCTC 7292 / S-41) TaxID=342451 RepID=Q49WC1_STAS1|nr:MULTISPECIES: oligopeptide ABC transporter permease [Staphylococcus]CRV24026.1 peptide/nickel transport system permease protein [Streptococcus equi subsp. equi]AMG20874.1 ABC transporter permease [Staphylococcus saprophyticus]AMG33944.1 ABC transporter permease [Staphylococcus saprophyticus]ASE59786.1 ABC transporter permease [Staphylococcus saprophyticus]ASF18588.1 ABC transporter permease [Staphylococcus saprophyticus]